VLDDDTMGAPVTSQSIGKLVQRLRDSLSQQSALPPPRSARLPRQARHFGFAPQCHIMPDERGQHFILQIQAVDQPSLLYRIARVLSTHRVVIHTARITTLGNRAEDFFLVSGDALHHAKSLLAIETDLIAALDQTAQTPSVIPV